MLATGGYYTFRNATGASYLLDQGTYPVYTSKQGAYVSYDMLANKLYFPDGSFWVARCCCAVFNSPVIRRIQRA
jgi:hypothetical protein